MKLFGWLVSLALMMTCGAAQGVAQQEVAADVVAKIAAAIPDRAPAAPRQSRRLLVFSKTNGFRHSSIAVGATAIKMLGEKTGAFTAVHSEDDALFQADRLQQFDAVLMLNTTGEVFRPKALPDDPQQRQQVIERERQLQQNLVDFVRGGRGLAGIHSATDTYKDWDQYNQMMGGAFASHPWHTEVPVRLLDPEHPLLRVFGGQGFTVVDEIYQFRNDTARPTERRMLMSLAADWDGLTKGSRDDGFYPISWIDRIGDGRIFYCSLGHREEIYWNPQIMQHYLAGLQYALGDLQADAEPIPVK